jgi:chemotaxis protein MotB
MRRKRIPEEDKINTDRWMLTYLDMITLLMIFFVVLYSMSIIDVQKFSAIAESLHMALGGGTPVKIELSAGQTGPSIFTTGTPLSEVTASGRGTDPSTVTTQDAGDTNQANGDSKEKMTLAAIKAKLDKFAADNGFQSTLVTSIEERGLVVRIQETLLFESGSAEITTRARDILNKISIVLAAAPNQIRIEGHTDNLPINTAMFPSNWELSVARATNVVHILQNDHISPDRLSAVGYGEFRPLYPNDTEDGRDKNRRIDLLILRSKYDLTEPGSQAPIPPTI